MRVLNRTALITGAAGGLGSACVRLFLREGANVVLFDRYESVQDLSATMGEHTATYVGDVTCPQDLDAAVQLALDQFGRIDTLVCSTGIVRSGNVLEMSLDEWQRVLDVNLTGPFLSCKSVLPLMVEQRFGSIVLVSSHFGLVGAPGLAAYCASKGGLIQLSKSIALDFGKYGIRANCLCPGMMQTRMLKDIVSQVGRSQDWMETMRNLPIPMASPEMVANAILFLASDESAAITGSVITADSGYTAR